MKSTLTPSQTPTSPGVTAPPAGLGGAAWWTVTGVALLGVGLLFWLAGEPLRASFDKILPVAPAPEVTAEPEPVAPPPPAPQEVVAPEEAAWTLVDVEESVKTAANEIDELMLEGQSELPEFGDLQSGDSPSAQRARRRFADWGQIWRNRVAKIGDSLPPEEACAVHAAMDPACRSLRSVLWTLESVAGAEDLGTAEERLDLATEKLDLFLNPPLPEEELTEAEPSDESESASDPS